MTFNIRVNQTILFIPLKLGYLTLLKVTPSAWLQSCLFLQSNAFDPGKLLFHLLTLSSPTIFFYNLLMQVKVLNILIFLLICFTNDKIFHHFHVHIFKIILFGF